MPTSISFPTHSHSSELRWPGTCSWYKCCYLPSLLPLALACGHAKSNVRSLSHSPHALHAGSHNVERHLGSRVFTLNQYASEQQARHEKPVSCRKGICQNTAPLDRPYMCSWPGVPGGVGGAGCRLPHHSGVSCSGDLGIHDRMMREITAPCARNAFARTNAKAPKYTSTISTASDLRVPS